MGSSRKPAWNAQHWLIDLRMRLGLGSYILFLLTIAVTITLPLVACFAYLIKGSIPEEDLIIGLLTAPIVTLLIVSIINPYVEFLFRLKRRIEVSQPITAIGSWEWTASDGLVEYSAESKRIFSLDSDCTDFDCALKRVNNSDLARVTAYVETVCAGKESAAIEFAIHADTGNRTLSMDCEIIHDDAGRFSGVIGTVKDISMLAEAQSARQQAERASRSFLEVIEQSPDAVMLLDASGTIE